jgi:hypothetical protein
LLDLFGLLAVVELTMTIGANGTRVLDGVWATIREHLEVVDFKKRSRALLPPERCRRQAGLTGSVCAT